VLLLMTSELGSSNGCCARAIGFAAQNANVPQPSGEIALEVVEHLRMMSPRLISD
jgi:hypothetical protein